MTRRDWEIWCASFFAVAAVSGVIVGSAALCLAVVGALG